VTLIIQIHRLSVVTGACVLEHNTARSWIIATPKRASLPSVAHNVSVVRLCIDASQCGTEVPLPLVSLVDALCIAKGWMSSAPGRAQAAARDAALVKSVLDVAVREGADGGDRVPGSAGQWAAECVAALLVSYAGVAEDAVSIDGDDVVSQLYGALTKAGTSSRPLWRPVRQWIESHASTGASVGLFRTTVRERLCIAGVACVA
jgi:phage-related baseplate assembly protein